MNSDSTHLTRQQGSRGGAGREGKRVCPVGTRQLGSAEPPLAATQPTLPPVRWVESGSKSQISNINPTSVFTRK